MPPSGLKSLGSLLDRPVNLSPRVGLLEHLSLVMQLAPLAQRDHALGNRPIGKIDPKWNQRQPPFLGLEPKTMELPSVQQQLTHPLGRMVPKRRLPILVDLAVDKPQLSIFESCISLLDAAASVPQALYLAAMENHPALDRIENLIVVLGLAVLGHTLEGRPFDRVGRFARCGRARGGLARTRFGF